MTRKLVISGVNLTEGGPLTVLRECLRAASAVLSPDWEIVALVHDRKLFDEPRVSFLEYPRSKRSWLNRLYYEFWHFHELSRRLRPDVWFSLHDISPRVEAGRQVVYCHNASPFTRTKLRDLWLEPSYFLFTLFYQHLYRINIHANDLIVVQQHWLREQFQKLYAVRNVAVAHPVRTPLRGAQTQAAASGRREVFFYPSLPRTFKNFEVVCQAATRLFRRIGPTFEVRLTLSGDENGYARLLYRQFAAIPVLKFIGRQTPAQMDEQYQQASVVVFPSLLESWGLPISEAKQWRKTLLLADLPYAHEALGSYDAAAFFQPHDDAQLAELMHSHLTGSLQCPRHEARPLAEPFAPDWGSLLRMVVDGHDRK